MDHSITRRGQPCWYRLPKVECAKTFELPLVEIQLPSQPEPCISAPMGAQVGLVACNDYIILESCIYRILKQHLHAHPSYTQLLELFHEVGAHQVPVGGIIFIPEQSSLDSQPAGELMVASVRCCAFKLCEWVHACIQKLQHSFSAHSPAHQICLCCARRL